MFKRIKTLELQVKELEKVVQLLVQKEQEEQQRLKPPVMGGRK